MAKKSTNGYFDRYRKSQQLLAKVRADLRYSRAINKDLSKDLREHKHLLEFYEQVNMNASLIKPMVPALSTFDQEQGTVMALLSDIHGEHKITRAQTNGMNELNPDITRKRLRAYFTNMMKLHSIFSKDILIDQLVWFWLGDMIHGFIHEEYMRTNYYSPIEAAAWMQDMLAEGVKYVLEQDRFSRIVIICKIGNHSRITKKVYSDEEAKMSYEWGIYRALSKMFPDIGWIIDESYHTYYRVYDKVIRAHHGHAFKYMGGIGGVTIPLMRYIAKLNRQRRADVDIMGHWHTRSFDPTDGYIINDCVCGADPYSIRLGFPISPPTQQFQILDMNRGLTINAPIML